MLVSLARLALARPLAVSLALAAVVAAFAAGAHRLQVAFSFRGFVGTSGAGLAALDELTETWGTDDTRLLVAVTSERGSLLARERLRALERALVRLEALPEVATVFGLPRARVAPAPGATVLQLDRLVDEDASSEDAVRARLRAAGLVPLLVDERGEVAAVYVDLLVNADDIAGYRPAMSAVRATLAEVGRDEGFSFAAAGVPAIRADFVDVMWRDQLIFVPLALLLAGLALLVVFRRPYGVLIPLGVALPPVGVLYGLMGWLDIPIDLLTHVFASLIAVIAIADAIHYLVRFHEEVRPHADRDGRIPRAARDEAIVATTGHVGAACFFTSVTTATGFASLVVSDMHILARFGLLAACGVLVAFAVLVVAMPLALRFVTRVDAAREGGLETVLARVCRASWRRAPLVLALSGVVIVAMVFAASRLDVDARLDDVVGQGHETRAANRQFDQALAGVVALHVDVRATGEGALTDPGALGALDRVTQWARARPEVRAAQGPTDVLRALHQAVVGENALPASAALVNQLLAFADGDPAVARLYRPADGRARVTVHLPDHGGRAITDFARALDEEVARELQGTELEAHVTGVHRLAYQAFLRLSDEMLLGLGLALLFILIAVAVLFRSPVIALLALPPNLLPLLSCVAFLGAVGWRLDPASVIVFCIALGLAVDDTIHFLARLNEERATGLSLADAIERTARSSGRALVATTVILCAGFLVQVLSTFPLNRVFGTLGAVALVTALIADLVLLPALLRLTVRGDEAPGASSAP